MKRAHLLLLLPAVAFLIGCEKEITVELPDTPERLVVEGTIEPGLPPFVILTRTQSFFEPLDASAISNSFVRGAVMPVDNGNGPIQLDQLCTSALTPEQRALFSEIAGLDPALVSNADICVYSTANTALFGNWAAPTTCGSRRRAKCSPAPPRSRTRFRWIPCGSDWRCNDPTTIPWASRGAHSTDPDTLGNCYRWMARRISRRPNGDTEDPTFISPLGNTFQDKYVNGLTFDFNFIRGRQFYSNQPEDENEEAGYYQVGDTIAVKFVSIGFNEHEFYTSYDENTSAARRLFGNPVNARTNITGGLGIWAGWGVYSDTIICLP